jgi:hypothetical protein
MSERNPRTFFDRMLGGHLLEVSGELIFSTGANIQFDTFDVEKDAFSVVGGLEEGTLERTG